MRVLAQEGGPLEVTFGSFESTWLWIVLAISLVALFTSGLGFTMHTVLAQTLLLRLVVTL